MEISGLGLETLELSGLGKSCSQQPCDIVSRSRQLLTLGIVQDLGESALILNILQQLQHSLYDRFLLEVHALNLIFQKLNFGSHLLPLALTRDE